MVEEEDLLEVGVLVEDEVPVVEEEGEWREEPKVCILPFLMIWQDDIFF